jgi:adenine-specific DNA-methyltransferase
MAKRKPKPTAEPTPVEAVKHADTRSNIPTREQGGLVAADEAAPRTVRYPRDPSLDPQLVWRGKDEQDAEPLEVLAVPLYIQEKIHPQFIVEDVRRRAAAGKPHTADLFADFNGSADPARALEFYQHDRHWTNRMILGDSLLVMTSLAEKERLKGRVQCVYFDPPYGIKFGSNWQVSTRKRDVKDAKADDLTRQPEQVRAFRDTWERGIHSYLHYLRDRLTVARELLTESGSVFVQIGDENVHLVRSVMDEVFGSENFCSLITFKKTSGAGSFSGGTNVLAAVSDYLVWYCRSIEHIKYRPLFRGKEAGGQGGGQYTWYEDRSGVRRTISNESNLTATDRIFRPTALTSQTTRSGQTTVFPVKFEGKTFVPGKGGWKTNQQGMGQLKAANRLIALGNTLCYVRYLEDFPAFSFTNLWEDTVTSGFGDPKVYVVQTHSKVIERCLLMTTDPGDLVLDPTCGSGTTAYVAEQWGRRWITIDTSRVALALARTRLMAARYPYYLLADSPEGRAKERDLIGVPTPADAPPASGDIRHGFVYKRVPHVTLKSIANNPDIREGMTREQIDAAIRRHAETETLFDQPYEDKSRVRVSGPFTVESLSPHRMLPAGSAESPPTPATVPETDFVTVILDNLRRAGVQNTKKGERLEFDRLDPYPGEFIQAEGTYTEAGGTVRRVAVCIGPEYGTVGPELLQDAAREALRGVGFDLLLLCGFAFDPHVSEEGKQVEKQVGKLRVLPVRANTDLMMGDALKKTGAGNLFLVFGEPDVALERQPDGKWVVEVKGMDVFDPTTGEVRPSGPNDIACWFIDTDYDGRSFFVRQAYFLGGNDPYEKLKRALRADVDEAEWSKLYSSRSVPFDPPLKGKVAVKVINHYGDEVLKVYPVGGK